MKSGTNRHTGTTLSGVAYLEQRLHDVINTPLGSLVGRRGFGSKLYTLVDRNVDSAFYMDAYMLLAEAINNPDNGLNDFKLKEMQLNRVHASHYSIRIIGYLDESQVDIQEIAYDG